MQNAKCKVQNAKWGTGITRLTLLLAFLVLVLLPSCQHKAGAGRTAIFVLFDISGSTSAPAVRQRYLEDFTAVLAAARGGDVIVGDVITDNSQATATYPIRQTLPVYDVFHFSRLTYDEALQAAQRRLRVTGRALILHSAPAPRTDLMNAFQLAETVLQGDATRGVTRKVLVVFSDMVEQSARYDFTVEPLTDSRAAEIIAGERSAGRLPDLHGVTVWVAGAAAAPRDGLPPDKIYAIQRFWLRYFAACGARLDKHRYATRLLHFRVEE